MNTSIIQSSKKVTKLLSFLLLAGTLFFTSCENFMKGQDIRKEIEEAIAYNNALSCDIIFRMNADVGEFLGSVDRTMREGFKTEVQLEINVDDYVFDTLQAVSQEDKTTSRADFVTIKELERDDKKGKYKYEITLEKFAKDILIQPVYKVRPKLGSILPASSNTPYNQDTSIVINFTNPVDLESFGDFSCISIYSDEDLTKKYFCQPVLSDDGKTLYIHTVEDQHILAPDGTKTITTIYVSYDFTNVEDNNHLKLTAKGLHEYKINKNFEGETSVNVWLPDSNDTGRAGSFSFPGSKTCIVKYTVDFQFNLNKEAYTFLGFKAFSYADPSQNLDEYVTITETDFDDQTGIYKANIRVNQNCNDIILRPVCLELPAVTKHTPETLDEQDANTPIVIYFNMPMEAQDAATSLFTKDNISLIYKDSAGNNTDMRDYFEDPYFDTTKQTLTFVPKIIPDGVDLKYFIEQDKKIPYADIHVSFSGNITVDSLDRYGKNLGLKQDAQSSFTVRYKANREETAPTKTAFFASASQINIENAVNFDSTKKFLQESLSSIEEDNDKILKNRTNGKIYLYGKYYDKGSGVKTVYVTEQRTNDKSGCLVNEPASTSVPYSIDNKNGASFITDSDGNTEFVIPYTIKADDGAIAITIAVKDACFNHDDAQDMSVVVIKDSQAFTGYIELENTKENITSLKLHHIKKDWILIWSGKCFSKLVYKDFELPLDTLTIKCEYVDKNGVQKSLNKDDDFSYISGEETNWVGPNYDEVNLDYAYYEFELKDLDNDSLSGKTIRIVVTDDLRNRKVTEFTFPKKPVPVSVKDAPGNSSDYEITFSGMTDEDELHFSGLYNEDDRDIDDVSDSPTDHVCKVTVDKDKVNHPEYDYAYHDLYAYYSRGSLCGPRTDIIDPEQLPPYVQTVTAIALDEDEPVTYETPLQTGMTNITVHIDSDSWGQEGQENYDRIYLRYKLTNSIYDPEYTLDFEKGQCEATVQLETQMLYNKKNTYSITMRVFGEKDDMISDGTLVDITKFTENKYDNMPPSGIGLTVKGKYTKDNQQTRYKIVDIDTGNTTAIIPNPTQYTPVFDRDNNLFRSAKIFANENESGITSVVVNVPGTNKSYTYSLVNGLLDFNKAETAYTTDVAFIPEWDLDAESIDEYETCSYEKLDVTLTCTDANKNYSTVTTELSRKLLPNFTNVKVQWNEDGGYWECLFETEDKGGPYWEFEARLYELELNGNNTKYMWYNARYGYQYAIYSWPYSNTMNHNNVFAYLDTGSVYKAFLTVTEDYNGIAETNYDPIYIIADNPSSDTYDYIQPVSGTKKAVLVSSDSTTYVHTLVTKKSYDECKDWDEEKWERNRKSVGEYIMSFTSGVNGDHTAKKYNIPMDEIDSGDCYVVVAHFANGKTARSEVMQKP